MQNNVLPAEKIYLQDGTELRLCKGIVSRTGNRKLYCSKAGLFYSLSTRGLNPNKPYVTKNFHRKPNVHSYYPRMCGFFGNPYCHILVAIAWVGPRRFNHECHHLNGNHTDNRASNLIWLSRANHKRYDARQKALRELLGNLQIFERSDFDRWHAMSEPDFQAMLAQYHRDSSFDKNEYDMTHHMEF